MLKRRNVAYASIATATVLAAFTALLSTGWLTAGRQQDPFAQTLTAFEHTVFGGVLGFIWSGALAAAFATKRVLGVAYVIVVASLTFMIAHSTNYVASTDITGGGSPDVREPLLALLEWSVGTWLVVGGGTLAISVYVDRRRKTGTPPY